MSATHLPAEELAVTVHGRAVPIDVQDRGRARVSAERCSTSTSRATAPSGSSSSTPASRYARIDAERMFTFFMPPEEA